MLSSIQRNLKWNYFDMTELVKHAPPQQLLLRETPKDSVNISSGFAIYDEDFSGWRTFYQLCHNAAVVVTAICPSISDNTRDHHIDKSDCQGRTPLASAGQAR
jgi:hypothetical protein